MTRKAEEAMRIDRKTQAVDDYQDSCYFWVFGKECYSVFEKVDGEALGFKIVVEGEVK